jgi:hypothetical protein
MLIAATHASTLASVEILAATQQVSAAPNDVLLALSALHPTIVVALTLVVVAAQHFLAVKPEEAPVHVSASQPAAANPQQHVVSYVLQLDPYQSLGKSQ